MAAHDTRKGAAPQGILRPSPSGDTPRKGSAHERIQWDEEVIAEHDKERGTRMPIDEPNTPYYGGALSLDEEHEEMLNLDPLDLGEVQTTVERGNVSPGQLQRRLDELEEEEASQDGGDMRRRSSDFEARRKAHYNEYKVMQSLRRSMSGESSDVSSTALSASEKQEGVSGAKEVQPTSTRHANN